ncbi:MAG TPA: hypothetical protein VHQ65_09105 [Thermoanaerobaculia bacterium]|nr:hypothetical protein [Thermoanaerobaculia bacterium]
MKEEDQDQPLGPRGGTTTVTKSGMVKKNLWIPRDEAEELRRRAFEERRSEADIIREGLRQVLGLEDEAPAS